MQKSAEGIVGELSLPSFLQSHWLTIRKKIERGSYYTPSPVKRVEIPKPTGGVRKLGIPTVLDRLIQQATAQILQAEWEPEFHSHSYGFRPCRNAHQAIGVVQKGIKQGRNWIVDCDLESFFDNVSHDRLMVKLKDKHPKVDKLLGLINRYPKAGVHQHGRIDATTKGVPQGGPLSPLLSNIELNELDWEMEKRGLTFARYADDFVVLVKSRRSGERVLARLQHFIERRLRLKVNSSKSAVDRPWNRRFLGITFSRKDSRVKVSSAGTDKLKATVRAVTKRTRGHTIRQIIEELKKSLLGWKAYFDIVEVLSPLKDLDKWIRRRLRCYIWKQWGRSGYRNLMRLGVDRQLAWNTAKSAHGPWRLSGSPALYRALPNKYFTHLGLPSLAAR